jgi:hypothetical protein
MPKISDMTSSKYLKKSDVVPDRVLTFTRFVYENVAKSNEPPEKKWVAYFDGEEKGLVLNKTNLKRAAAAMGSDNTDDWVGKSIVAYFDENVEFGGDLVGGIRLRAAKPAGSAPPARKPIPVAPDVGDGPNDDIPF